MTIKKKNLVVLLSVIVLIGLWGYLGFYRVGQGEQALVLSFGKVTELKGPGLYWKFPLIQEVISKSVSTIYNAEYGYRTAQTATSRRSAEYTDDMSESVMLTNDNSIVQLEAIYQYTIRDVRAYCFSVDDPERTMHLAFEAILRRNVQNKSLDEALLNKFAIEAEVLPDFQALIDSYQMGVKINSVHIQNITVPKEVNANYEDVNNAKSEKTRRLDEAQQYENQVLPLANSKAYDLTQQALGYEASVKARAEAETASFKAVYEKYKAEPEISKSRMIIETMESVLGGAGRIVLSDNDSDILKHLDIGQNPGAAAEDGEINK